MVSESTSIMSLTFLAAALFLIPPSFASPVDVAPYYVPEASARDLVNNSYLVMFKDDIPTTSLAAHMSFLDYANAAHPLHDSEVGENGEVGAAVEQVYTSVVKGYAGRFSGDALDMIRRRPEVKYVERDRKIYANSVQRNPPWGLARIAHRKVLQSNKMHYLYDPRGGEGVTVYVIDTGVYINHPEFQGRARWGKTVNRHWSDADKEGHGTHCAGTIASNKYGVAKKAYITAVKALGDDGSGTSSEFVAGLDWAVNDAMRLARIAAAELKATGRTSFKGVVASASLGGPKSRSELDAVNNAVKHGMHIAVAAGNEAEDACKSSPAAAELPITVGASEKDDSVADYSNHGKCVDVFAPGTEILSTWNSRNKLTNTISGTSMATPHVAGLLAYFLSIYPHSTFNPRFNGYRSSLLTSTYAALYSAMPNFMSGSLPTPHQSTFSSESEALSPLTPERLKRAVLRLSSHNKLRHVPRNTPNLLVFSNGSHATMMSAFEHSDDFWADI